ncbi:MAG: hypothetical protein JWM85_2328 [Acidimicrobiaceae bacterium]|nr:hypothetical protein [Acidimicrobiaceae bacterium]
MTGPGCRGHLRLVVTGETIERVDPGALNDLAGYIEALARTMAALAKRPDLTDGATRAEVRSWSERAAERVRQVVA